AWIARAVPHAPAPMTATLAIARSLPEPSAAERWARTHREENGIAHERREEIGAAVRRRDRRAHRFCRSLEAAGEGLVSRAACARDRERRGRRAQAEDERTGV